MKKIITLGAMAILLCATSCSTDETVNNEVNNDGKEKIQFAAGDNQVLTSRAGFTEQTRIVARIVSDSRIASEADKCVTTVLSAKKGTAGENGYSEVVYAENNTRYWDDAYGRNSILSVYAVAIPNVENGNEGTNLPTSILKGSSTWSTQNASDNSLSWTVKTTQEYADLAAEDLTYSNNIQEGNVGGNGVYTWNYYTGAYPTFNPSNATKHTVNSTTDGRLYFTQQGKQLTDNVTDAAGHFDRGQMEFRHSLTRIQVNLIKGDGYDTTFDITDIHLLNQKYKGTFDIKTATWSNPTAGTINMAKWETPATRNDSKTNAATYEAQILPGYEFADNTNNELELTVDGNSYFITNKMLREALGDNEKTTAMGKRYIFDIKVAKNKIQNITATVVDWDEVNASEFEIKNAHISFTFKNSTGTDFNGMNLYKRTEDLNAIVTTDSYSAESWSGEYVGPATLTENGGKYTTNWYYDDNQTAYHLRMINDAAKAKLTTNKSSFAMSSGNVTDHDYEWGAPMKSDAGLAYSTTNGYANSLHKGIISNTSEDVHITGFHMMSELQVNLTTPAEGGVNLDDATVTLTYFYDNGSVDMGTGKVSVSGELKDKMQLDKTSAADKYEYVMAVIPQSLVRTSGTNNYIGITIHTKDNNEYYIIQKLSDICVDNTTTPITEWISGKRYIYTFNIKKTKIENITATVADWINVNAAGKDITLED